MAQSRSGKTLSIYGDIVDEPEGSNRRNIIHKIFRANYPDSQYVKYMDSHNFARTYQVQIYVEKPKVYQRGISTH